MALSVKRMIGKSCIRQDASERNLPLNTILLKEMLVGFFLGKS